MISLLFQLHYNGLVFFTKTVPLFAGFCCLRCVFPLLNSWSKSRDSAPLNSDIFHDFFGERIPFRLCSQSSNQGWSDRLCFLDPSYQKFLDLPLEWPVISLWWVERANVSTQQRITRTRTHQLISSWLSMRVTLDCSHWVSIFLCKRTYKGKVSMRCKAHGVGGQGGELSENKKTWKFLAHFNVPVMMNIVCCFACSLSTELLQQCWGP